MKLNKSQFQSRNAAKKYRNKKRLLQATNNACIMGTVECVKDLLSQFNKSEIDSLKEKRQGLLYYAVINGNKEVSEFLYQEGFFCDKAFVAYCDYLDIHSCYEILQDLGFNPMDKYLLVSRLINPHKVEANANRLAYLYQQMEAGFFSQNDVDVAIRHLPDTKSAYITTLLRESKLNSLFKIIV